MTATRPITFPAICLASVAPTDLPDLFDTEDCDDSGACAHFVDQHAQEAQRGEAIRCA